jgi:hypothetical protein
MAKMIPGRIPCLGSAFWPNVKDEPRRHLARRVPEHDQQSVVSIS